MRIVPTFLPPIAESNSCARSGRGCASAVESQKAGLAAGESAGGAGATRRIPSDAHAAQRPAADAQRSRTGAERDRGEERSARSAPDPEQSASSARDALKLEYLTEAEKQLIMELRVRDQQVRQHEQQHRAAAGSLAKGPIQYHFQIGPDGQRYAVGGEIDIDISPEQNPEATAAKAQQIIRAATAVADPSPQDRRVAAQARLMLADAEREMAMQRLQEQSDSSEAVDAPEPMFAEETLPEVGRRDEPIEALAPQSEPDWILLERGGQEILDLIQMSRQPQEIEFVSRVDSAQRQEAWTPPAGVGLMLAIERMDASGEWLERGGQVDIFV